MSRLDLAADRLKGALAQLESAALGLGEERDAAARAAEQIAQLEAERERLLARVADLEQELAALSAATNEVETRLDGAIGEIRAALSR
jgi:chromosome segregation ATPase